MLNFAERRLSVRQLLALAAVLLFTLWAGARAARADDVAGLSVQAGQPSPALIGPGDSYSVPFYSKLEPNESGVEDLLATSQNWAITSVCYSTDDVNWTTIWKGDSPVASLPPGSYGISLSLSGSTGSATLSGDTSPSTPDGFYLVSVSTTANYDASVNGKEQQGTASGGGATTEPVAQITNVSVGSPATETNMIQNYPNPGDINYGVVKQSTGQPVANAMATATTSPATVPVENQIKWTGGTAVSGNDAERNYSLATSQKYTIDPTLAGHDWAAHNVYLWVIWATVKVNTSGKISPDDKAPALVNGDWPAELGGGTSLGPIDCLTDNNLTYAYAVGRYEAQASITPSGVWNVVGGGPYTHYWAMDRSVDQDIYDNGLPPPAGNPISQQDDSARQFESQTPTGANGGTIYDLDAPACSADLYFNVNHTAEVYDDFKEWAVVQLDKTYQCSEKYEFYYDAQVDADNKLVNMNKLGAGNPALPAGPYYKKR